MSSIDQQFVEFIVKSVVSKPDEVKIERRIDEKGVLLELTVDPDDLGRVIGKRGATAQSLRTLLRALGTKNDARYNLKIIDNGEGGPYGHEARSDSEEPKRERSERKPREASKATPAPANEPSSTPASTSDDDDDDTAAADDAKHSDALSKTRKELEELDDLDV